MGSECLCNADGFTGQRQSQRAKTRQVGSRSTCGIQPPVCWWHNSQVVGTRRGTTHAIFKDLSLVGAGHHSHLQRPACDKEQHGAQPCKMSGEAIGLCSLSFLPQLQVLKQHFWLQSPAHSRLNANLGGTKYLHQFLIWLFGQRWRFYKVRSVSNWGGV